MPSQFARSTDTTAEAIASRDGSLRSEVVPVTHLVKIDLYEWPARKRSTHRALSEYLRRLPSTILRGPVDCGLEFAQSDDDLFEVSGAVRDDPRIVHHLIVRSQPLHRFNIWTRRNSPDRHLSYSQVDLL